MYKTTIAAAPGACCAACITKSSSPRASWCVVRGAVFYVVVDIRKDSLTFGKWEGMELSEDNRKQFWIPAGFAHGFLVTSDSAEFLYKTVD